MKTPKNAFIIAAMLIFALIFWVSEKNKTGSKKVLSEKVFGLDWSGYQGSNLGWDSIVAKRDSVSFIILRGTRGDDRLDSAFLRNFANAKKNGFIVGFYHYTDPNEDFKKQANNYLRMSKLLIKGDLIPMLDVEALPNGVSRQTPDLLDSFNIKIRWFLDTIQQVHGVKPILYTNLGFYKENLNDSLFSNHPKWIAAYSKKRWRDPLVLKSMIHQYDDSVRVPGVGWVDGNKIRGTAFDSLLIK